VANRVIARLWLQDLEKENPELVKQIHVFSSFFYKKLDNKDAKGKGR
jgi:Ulp1 family protease